MTPIMHKSSESSFFMFLRPDDPEFKTLSGKKPYYYSSDYRIGEDDPIKYIQYVDILQIMACDDGSYIFELKPIQFV